MASKYLKNSEGIVRAITTDNLQLEKPLLNENYDIEVHNRNMEKIDKAIQEVKGKVEGLELKAEKVTISDTEGLFEATNVEEALLENKTSILNNTDLANQALNKANEAFQRGDNVKTQLVDKLISEGLDVSTDNTFEELIGNIALGKKWASGNMVIPYSTSITKTSPYSIPCKLDFEPSLVFVCMQKCKYTYNSSLYGNDRVTLTNLRQSAVCSMPITLEYVSNSIVISILGGDSIKYFDQTETTTWYAFE